MSNHAKIFLIDLGERASAIQKALSAMGFQVGAGTHEQLAGVIGQALPHVIVAPEPILGELKAALEQTPGGTEVLLFLLSKDPAALSQRVPLGATARVPADIDAGVLGLRIQAAAQTSTSLRNRQATLVGFTAADLAPPGQLTPSVPPSLKPAPASVAPAPVESSGRAPIPPPLSQPPTAKASTPPPVPSAVPAPPSKPAASSAQSDVAKADSVTTSAPPLPSLSKIPAAGASPKAMDSVIPLSQPVPLQPISFQEPSAASANPVALTLPPDALETAGSKKKKLLFASVAAAVVLLGVGAFALSGSSGEESLASGQLETSGEKPTQQAVAAAKPETKEPAAAEAPSGKTAAAPNDSAASAEPAVAGEPAASANAEAVNQDSQASLFRIASPTELESCEKQLGKSEEDFQSAPKWKSAQAWKLARKSLMSGKQEQAAKQMCESAFIDPRGPAVAGLVNYYLSERALEQAHKWALKGVEVSPESRAAQEALGDVLNQMGRVEEAREIWLKSFGLEEKDDAKLAGVVKNYVRSAVAARRGGAYPLAERLLRRALSFDPENADAVALFITTLRKNGQDQLAEKWDS